MSAKKDLTRLAEFLGVPESAAVDEAILALCEPAKAVQNETTTVPGPRQRLVLVASNKAKQGSQPWSQWSDDINTVVETLVERVKANGSRPGLQYEVAEVEVLQRAAIEVEVRAVNVT